MKTIFRILLAAFLPGASCVLFDAGCTPRPPEHGTAFVAQFETNRSGTVANQEALVLRTRETLLKRMDGFLGTGRAFVETTNGERFVILCPRLDDRERKACRRMIETPGRLEFRMVHPESESLLTNNIVEPGYEVLTEGRVNRDGTKSAQRYLVKKEPERGLTGQHIRRAAVTRDSVVNTPNISFELDPEGARLFAELTREWSPKGANYYQLAIVLDGVLYSAPRIMGPIEGGRGQISGSFDAREAIELANLLEHSLEVPLKVLEEKTF